MDLLVIARKIWRYRLATIPVILLTLFGAFYVVVVKDPEYEASSSYILINPPPPPTEEDIAINPALGLLNADNPFTRFTDQSAVVGLLASRLSNESTRDRLSDMGADRRYTVAPSSEFSSSSLLVEITGVGSTPQQATGSAAVVGDALVRELDTLQESRDVALPYRIKAQLVTAPESAQRQVSSTLRPLVGVLALGVILLFVVISAADALGTLRAEQSREGGIKRRGPQKGIDGRANINLRAPAWLRRHRGKDREEEVASPKGKDESIEGVGTNGSAAERKRGPRGVGSKA